MGSENHKDTPIKGFDLLSEFEPFRKRGGLMIQDFDGNTALMLATINRQQNPDKFLEKALFDECPLALTSSNRLGLNPLHVLVQNLCSNETAGVSSAMLSNIESLLKHFSTSREIFKAAMCMQTHETGHTPLHMACMISNEESVSNFGRHRFLTLLQNTQAIPANPDNALDKNNFCIPPNEKSVFKIEDHNGCTPLHLAVLSGAPNSVIAVLLLSDPSASRCTDCDGYTPLYKAFHKHNKEIQELLGQLERLDYNRFDQLNPSSRQSQIRNQLNLKDLDLLDKLAMLTQGQCVDTDMSPSLNLMECKNTSHCAYDHKNLLHCAASIVCPTDVFHLFIKMFPEQLDEYIDGEQPLHRWCRNQEKPPFRESLPQEDDRRIEDVDPEDDSSAFTSDKEDAENLTADQLDERTEAWERRGNRKDIVELILRYAPEVVKNEDSSGRTPLNLAIEHNKLWEGEIEVLLKSSPEMLNIRDPDSNLYPFMLAASLGERSEGIEKNFFDCGESYKRQKRYFRDLEGDMLSASNPRIHIMYEKSRRALKAKRVELLNKKEKADIERRRLGTIYKLLLDQPDLVRFGIPTT